MIDIIVPVYNTPIEDLRRCFESVKRQKYKKYNVIIVDDGSNYEIARFLDSYCDNKKFKVIHIPNGGVSNARNVGIDNSRSEYIAFLDSDDEITPNFFRDALKKIIENDLDFISGGIIIKSGSKEIIKNCETGLHIFENAQRFIFLDRLLTNINKRSNTEFKNALIGRVMPKIIKKELLSNIRFNDKIHTSEDNLFCIDLVLAAKKIGVCSDIWYVYNQNDYSKTHEKSSLKNIKEEIDFAKEVYLSSKEYKVVENSFKIRLLWIYIVILGIYRNLPSNEKKQINIISLMENEIFSEALSTVTLKNYIFDNKKKKYMYYLLCRVNKYFRNIILKILLFL